MAAPHVATHPMAAPHVTTAQGTLTAGAGPTLQVWFTNTDVAVDVAATVVESLVVHQH